MPQSLQLQLGDKVTSERARAREGEGEDVTERIVGEPRDEVVERSRTHGRGRENGVKEGVKRGGGGGHNEGASG